jgi:hypothetical protein
MKVTASIYGHISDGAKAARFMQELLKSAGILWQSAWKIL